VKKSKDTGSYEDFIECLKLYDKMENGTMMLGELEHILLSLGEKLGKLIIKGTLPPDFLFYTYCGRTFPTGFTANSKQIFQERNCAATVPIPTFMFL
jgi:hypothetical protein